MALNAEEKAKIVKEYQTAESDTGSKIPYPLVPKIYALGDDGAFYIAPRPDADDNGVGWQDLVNQPVYRLVRFIAEFPFARL